LTSERSDLACPYFMPLHKVENGAWQHPARLPLGGGWSGHCTAPEHDTEVPSQAVLEGFCNLGYASGCAWMPSARAWDAVRLAVVAPAEAEKRRKSNEQNERAIVVRYVCERNHRPVEHGELTYDLSRAHWLQRHDDPRVQKMAECFLESYTQKRI
jgi:hypothetical protein